ncbi:MAG: TIGR00266 family protein [Lachnospirales bacterium]
MEYKISQSTFAPTVSFFMNIGENVRIERGSFLGHNGKIDLAGKTNGGFFKSIGRALTSGESMFITTATATESNAQLTIAPHALGEIMSLEVGNNQYILNDGVFLASTNGVEYDVKRVSGIGKALLGGSGGFFNMHTKGNGQVFISGFGEIVEYELKFGEKIVIDNSHVVAWDSNLTYNLDIASGTFGFKSGEGLAMYFSGEGKIYVQSRQLPSFGTAISPYIITGN